MLLRSPIQNISSWSSSRKLARPTYWPGTRVRRSVKALTRVLRNGYRLKAPTIRRPGAANSQGLVGRWRLIPRAGRRTPEPGLRAAGPAVVRSGEIAREAVGVFIADSAQLCCSSRSQALTALSSASLGLSLPCSALATSLRSSVFICSLNSTGV